MKGIWVVNKKMRQVAFWHGASGKKYRNFAVQRDKEGPFCGLLF